MQRKGWTDLAPVDMTDRLEHIVNTHTDYLRDGSYKLAALLTLAYFKKVCVLM